MKYNESFINLIYNYLVTRFRFQYYKYGEKLPTIDFFCSQFGVSALTIKIVLKRLQNEGYISMGSGRFSNVIFRQSDKEMEEFAIRFFAERRMQISDLNTSSDLIIMPMLIKGFKKMNENDYKILTQFAEKSGSEDLLKFYSYILQKTENPLVMNLFWENILFLGLPFPMMDRGHKLYDVELCRKRLKTLINCGKSGDSNQIRAANYAFQRDISYNILHYIDVRIPKTINKQISFEWNVYRDRPQIYCRLAIRIIHDVYMEDYRNIEFLPSIQKMAQKYEVSISTMRRTIHFLNQLGAVKTINGKGTRILLMKDNVNEYKPDFTIQAIRNNMAYFIQAFELLAESSEGVMNVVFSSLSKNERMELSSLLEDYLCTNRYTISLQSVYAFIAEHSPFRGLQEIYGKLYGLNLLGYPLRYIRKECPDVEQKLYQFTKILIESLRDNNVNLFSKSIGEFVKEEYLLARSILLTLNFKAVDLRKCTEFSLLNTNEI